MRARHAELIGVWKLVSFDVEWEASGQREPFYGPAIPGGYYKLDGDRLDITTAWMPHPIYPERGSTRSRLRFERTK